MKEDTKKRLQRFIVRNNYVLRFITATLFALIVVISVIFGLKALFLELSIPNRPIVIPIFRKVRQSGTIEDGRPVYGEETYMPLQLRNVGRKPAIDITWTFAITGVGKFPGENPGPFSRRDSIDVIITDAPNPIYKWGYKICNYQIEYKDQMGNIYFNVDSILIKPIICNHDRRKMGGLIPASASNPIKRVSNSSED